MSARQSRAEGGRPSDEAYFSGMKDSAHEIQTAAKPTVYYDGSCPLCSVEIRHYQAREGAEDIAFVDVSAASGDLGDGLTCDVAMQRFHVRMPDGTLKSGAAGFAVIWAMLPGWTWLARIARVPGVLPVMELAYRAFLPVRPAMSWIARRFGARPINESQT